MKKFFKGLLKVLGVFILIGVIAMISMIIKMNAAMKQQVNVAINMEEIPDGIYYGKSDGGLVKVEVAVTVKDHQIEDIDLLEHVNGKGKPAECITEDMIAQNTYDVDAVSGATASSTTIKHAVNVALQSAKSK